LAGVGKDLDFKQTRAILLGGKGGGTKRVPRGEAGQSRRRKEKNAVQL